MCFFYAISSKCNKLVQDYVFVFFFFFVWLNIKSSRYGNKYIMLQTIFKEKFKSPFFNYFNSFISFVCIYFLLIVADKIRNI